MFPCPVIDPLIARIAPGFRAISLFVDTRGANPTPLDPAILADACGFVTEGGPA